MESIAAEEDIPLILQSVVNMTEASTQVEDICNSSELLGSFNIARTIGLGVKLEHKQVVSVWSITIAALAANPQHAKECAKDPSHPQMTTLLELEKANANSRAPTLSLNQVEWLWKTVTAKDEDYWKLASLRIASADIFTSPFVHKTEELVENTPKPPLKPTTNSMGDNCKGFEETALTADEKVLLIAKRFMLVESSLDAVSEDLVKTKELHRKELLEKDRQLEADLLKSRELYGQLYENNKTAIEKMDLKTLSMREEKKALMNEYKDYKSAALNKIEKAVNGYNAKNAQLREKKQELEIATLDYKAAKEDLDICREKLSRLEVEHQAEGVELANLRKENRNLNALLLSKRSNEKVEKDRFAEAIRAVTVEKKKQLQQMAEENEILAAYIQNHESTIRELSQDKARLKEKLKSEQDLHFWLIKSQVTQMDNLIKISEITGANTKQNPEEIAAMNKEIRKPLEDILAHYRKDNK